MNTIISIRTNKQVKKAAQEIAESVGVSLSTLINSYLKQLIVTRRVELIAPEPMTPKLESLIASVESELASGKISQQFESVDDFLTDLKK